MKATLEFSLPDEEDDFKQATNAGDMALGIFDVYTKLHWWWDEGHEFKTADEAVEAFWNLFNGSLGDYTS